ncbi:MAG: LacI family DNA-binding transcriptional regulator [Acidobacteria bacterium]|nr:LacI family DNA-binding transcriptional regulator [Acidobacteriota bacterium]
MEPTNSSARGEARTPAVVTIREVAKQSGFSSATVSIVLNNAPLARYIPESTKKRIQRAAQKLGYRPNLFARTLRNQRTHTVGVMVFDMTDPYCIPTLRGIESTLYEAAFLPILTDVHNERNRFERYLEMLLDRRVEALIVVANWLFVDIGVLADLEKSKVPTAMIGRELKAGSVSSVTVDNELGAAAAIEHLFALGHRQIAFIRGPRHITDSAPRWRGVRQFSRLHGLEINPDLVMDLPGSSDPLSSFDAGYNLTEELLRKRCAFTALMAFDDMTALGAIRALHRAGIRVPDQCSVIGFDDISHSAILTPALTTIRQPLPEMGKMAGGIVIDAIAARQERQNLTAKHRKLRPELMVRDSTCRVA